MSTVMTHSELLKRAVTYVSETKQEYSEKRLSVILDEAAMRFNLSPVDGETLHRLFKPEPANENQTSAVADSSLKVEL